MEVRKFLNENAEGILRIDAILNLIEKFRLTRAEATRKYEAWRKDFVKPKIAVEELLQLDEKRHQAKLRAEAIRHNKIQIELGKNERERILNTVSYIYQIPVSDLIKLTELKTKGVTNLEISRILGIEKIIIEILIARLRDNKLWSVRHGWMC